MYRQIYRHLGKIAFASASWEWRSQSSCSRYADPTHRSSISTKYFMSPNVRCTHTETTEITFERMYFAKGKRHWYLWCMCRNGNLFGMKFSQTVLARWVFLTRLRARIQRTMENYTVRSTMRQYNLKIWFCYFIDKKLHTNIYIYGWILNWKLCDIFLDVIFLKTQLNWTKYLSKRKFLL